LRQMACIFNNWYGLTDVRVKIVFDRYDGDGYEYLLHLEHA
jgi:hypothetical protein